MIVTNIKHREDAALNHRIAIGMNGDEYEVTDSCGGEQLSVTSVAEAEEAILVARGIIERLTEDVVYRSFADFCLVKGEIVLR